ncbi:spondin-2-like [Pectinophora gossypiella]|uniref:spondin-2-like n=1 Tax=Pectinophora gossypiella TaxID=13191 RepID=UPI00214E2B9E|nr:spondin-2-like [Pectinophora gossypiella]
MAMFKLKGCLKILITTLLLQGSYSQEEMEICNKKPLQTKTAPLPPDNRFVLEIVGVDNDYIPNTTYTVRLYAKDEQASFIAFTISATGDQKPNERNPRKPIILEHGRILSSINPDAHDTTTKSVCPDTVFQANVMPKTSVEAQWIAPPKGNKCVTIYAYVAVKPDVWYSSDGPLSKKVCEDHRKNEDMKPPENNDCRVCEEARYELKFEGSWSYNTHPLMYPKTDKEVKFSDIVGASHGKNFILYRDNADASEGLQMLAKQGNTTRLEEEILEMLGDSVRTVIKATGPPKTWMSTVTSFRTSAQHHFISLACAIIPSPDWFLGVYNMELCDVKTGNWATNVVLNLYPMDAGIDSGLTFESSDEATLPPKPIAKADISREVPYDKMRPFAKLIVTLVRTYANPNCIQETFTAPSSTDEEFKPEPPTSPPVVLDPNNEVPDCPVSSWEEWLPCEDECIDGKIDGYQTRFRYHVINGVAIKNFEDENGDANTPEVPEECEEVSTSETRHCEEPCTEQTDEPEAERRIWSDRLKPGQRWSGRN